MYPFSCIILINLITTLDTGLMITCFFPFFSAFTITLRQSANTFILTIPQKLILFNKQNIEVNKIQSQFQFIIKSMNLLQALSSSLTAEQPKFKQIFTPQQRWKKHLNIVKGNPNHISVVIQPKFQSHFKFKKPYLLLGLEKSCSIAQLNANIRHILSLEDKQALFLYCGKILPSGHEKIKSIERFVQPDGFLYFTIGDHQVYG